MQPIRNQIEFPMFILAANRNRTKHNIEVRQEAVQQALAALKNRPKPSLPMPSKRSSVLNRSPDRDRDDTGNVISCIRNCVKKKTMKKKILCNRRKQKNKNNYKSVY